MVRKSILLDGDEMQKRAHEEATDHLLLHLKEYDTAKKSKETSNEKLDEIKSGIREACHELFRGLDPKISELLLKENLTLEDMKEFKRIVMKTTREKLDGLAKLRIALSENQAAETDLKNQSLSEHNHVMHERVKIQAEIKQLETELKPYLKSGVEMNGESPTWHQLRRGMAKFVEGARGVIAAIGWAIASGILSAAEAYLPSMAVDYVSAIVVAVKGATKGVGEAVPKSAKYWTAGFARGENKADEISYKSLSGGLDRVITMVADAELESMEKQRHKFKTDQALPHRHPKMGTFQPAYAKQPKHPLVDNPEVKYTGKPPRPV